MAIQSNFPSLKPTLLLDFANTKQLDPRITFTRASTATYYDGVTTAKAEENLLLWSEDVSQSVWTLNVSTKSLVSGTNPLGVTQNISRVDALGNARGIAQTYAATGTFTLSVWLRTVSGSGVVALRLNGIDGGTNFTITSNWVRYTVTGTGTLIDIRFLGQTSGDSFEFWGAQLEQRSAVTAYTATTTQAITNYIPALQSAASGVARFDNNPTTGESLGLLIEESRTNLLTYSAQFDNAVWDKINVSVTANMIVAPDGTLSGDQITTLSTANYIREVGISTSSSPTLSVYAKAGTEIWLLIDCWSSSGAQAWFNLSTGTLGTTAGSVASSSITSVGNGWYRCSVTRTASGLINTDIRIVQANGSTASTTGSYFYLWGAQLENGSFATSYIPTVASQVTRAADAASMTGTNFSSWFNVDQGSFVINAARAAIQDSNGSGGYGRILGNDAGTNSFLEYSPTPTTLVVSGAGSYNFILSGLSTAASVFNNMTVAYSSTGISVTANNLTVQVSSASARMATSNRLVIFGSGTGSYSSSGWVKRVAYYPIKVTSTNLQALTS
jgi:hypothetical protein